MKRQSPIRQKGEADASSTSPARQKSRKDAIETRTTAVCLQPTRSAAVRARLHPDPPRKPLSGTEGEVDQGTDLVPCAPAAHVMAHRRATVTSIRRRHQGAGDKAKAELLRQGAPAASPASAGLGLRRPFRRDLGSPDLSLLVRQCSTRQKLALPTHFLEHALRLWLLRLCSLQAGCTQFYWSRGAGTALAWLCEVHWK